MRISIRVACGLALSARHAASASIRPDNAVEDAARRYSAFMSRPVADCSHLVSEAFRAVANPKCDENLYGRHVVLADGSSIVLTNDNVVVAKVARDAASFCNKRSMYQYLAQIDGIMAHELTVASGIPAECRNLIVVYEESKRSYDRSLTEGLGAYRLAADALELVGRLHDAGFIHGHLGQDVFEADESGHLKLGGLSSATPRFKQRGDLLPSTGAWVKNDLIALLNTHFKNWIGDDELFESMMLAVKKTSPDKGKYLDYRYWVDVLRQLADGNEDVEYARAPRGHRALEDAPLVGIFHELNEQCLIGLPQPLPDCSTANGCVCPPSEPFLVSDLGNVQVAHPDYPLGDFHGDYGNIFKLVQGTALMKVFTKLDEPLAICSEQSVLRTLEGLGGLVPVQYLIEEGVHEACKVKSFVMQIAGSSSVDINKSGLWNAENPAFYSIFARTLEVLRVFHSTGFIHGDLHIDNIKINSAEDVDTSLMLIDFGLTRPFVDAAGVHLLDPQASRAVDMERFGMELNDLEGWKPRAVQEAIDEYKDEMASLGREEEPDYQKWIDKFRALVSELVDEEDYGAYDD